MEPWRRAAGGGEVVIPADYVARHLELAYATTAYRAQGRSVDTTHSMVSPTTTREVLYVAATRGRESNRLYVETSYDPDPATSHEGTTAPRSAKHVLSGVLANEGADISAHETMRRAQYEAEDFTTLAAEYNTLARAAQEQRWEALLERSGLDRAKLDQILESDAFGPMLVALRDAEARGLHVDGVFSKLIAGRSLADADDPASVLHRRVDRWIQGSGSRRPTPRNLIAGLIPRAMGVTGLDMVRALDERDQALERQARELALQAVERGDRWITRLGTPPTDPARREQWIRAVSTVAAFRDRWNIGNDDRLLGPEGAVRTTEATSHRKLAHASAEQAINLCVEPRPRRTETDQAAGAEARMSAPWDSDATATGSLWGGQADQRVRPGSPKFNRWDLQTKCRGRNPGA
jgi:hypothetical protein